MLTFFRSLFFNDNRSAASDSTELDLKPPPSEVCVLGAPVFTISSHLSRNNGFPFLDWSAAQQWIEAINEPEIQAIAWGNCERAWLEHMRASLGSGYRLMEAGDAMLLSTLEPNVVRATLEFIAKTQRRIVGLLDGVAQVPEWGKEILIVFDDEDSYYKYVSHYYPEEGEFAASGGMYINAGCGHFVTVKADLRAIEPVIAHELTHGCLSHLPIPAWLNEGLAVNTEHRLSPSGAPFLTPQQMHDKHLGFWRETEIQEFWSGQSFLRNDDGNMLSYDLARIMVSQLSQDWVRFRTFILACDVGDAGAAAALQYLGLDLGEVAC